MSFGPAWRYYAGFYRGHARALVLGLAAAAAQTLVALPLILLARLALDRYVPAGELLPLLAIGGAMLGLYALQTGLFLLARHITLTVTKTAVRQLRHELLETLQRMPRANYARADLREWHTRIVEDSERVDVMSNALLSHLLPSIPPAIVLSAALLYLDPLLFGLSLVALPLVVFGGRRLRRILRRRVETFHAAFAAYSESVHHSLHLADLIRSHATEALERDRHADRTETLRGASRRMAFLHEAYHQLHYLALATVAVVTLVAGGYAVSNGIIGLGDFGAFLVALALLRTHLQSVAGAVPQVIAGDRALESVYRLIASDQPQPYQGHQPVPFDGTVRIDGVDFGYAPGRRLLRSIDLDLVPGRVTALTGANGSGKTTLAHLIMGFYRPDSGALYAGGHAYDRLAIQSLRRRIGYAPQRPLLFPGTVAENLGYADPQADRQAVVRAAGQATAADFIGLLPDGYDTVIGEGGMGLSGGQQQRLGLAQALLKRPRLLILDEPSASLDAATTTTLLANLRRLQPPPAILAISHDRQVLDWSDEVYRLDRGRLTRQHPETTQ